MKIFKIPEESVINLLHTLTIKFHYFFHFDQKEKQKNPEFLIQQKLLI